MKESEDNKEKQVYKEIINDFLIKNKNEYNIEDINKINISFEKLGGGMNKNFLITIGNKENNKNIKFFFRAFGKLMNDGSFDRKKEAEIIKKLGKMGYGPKLLDFDYKNERYRIDEYLDNTQNLPGNKILDQSVINNLIIIINEYSKVSDIYHYEIIEENSKKSIKLSQTGNNPFQITKNIYHNLINNIYNKAKNNFEKYYTDYNEINIKDNYLNDENINKIKDMLNEFINLLISFFNKKGFFVLNHHDLHGLNVLLFKDTNKIFIIDNEFSCLSLIGFDIVWYMIMSLFQYDPNYEYYPHLMDYNKFYQIYLQYMDCFTKSNEDWINKEQERIDYIKYIKKEKYFCELLCVSTLFAYIISLLDLNFKKENILRNGDIFLINVLNMIQLFEFSYDKYKNEKNK